MQVTIKGVVHWIHAKELDAWVPKFLSDNDNSSSEDGFYDSEKGSKADEEEFNSEQGDKEVEHVFETTGMHDKENLSVKVTRNFEEKKSQSSDPFNIYTLLRKENNNHPHSKESKDSDPLHPPGFTPIVTDNKEEGSNYVNDHKNSDAGKKAFSYHNVEVPNTSMPITDGSILNVMDDLVKGNLAFDHAVSPTVGNSGGILCIWDSNMFIKEHVSSSEYFLAIMWDGETVVLGDFNEVRTEQERFGSSFNIQGFDKFVEDKWKSMNVMDLNGLIRLKKKLQLLKNEIKAWIKERRKHTNEAKSSTTCMLTEVDKLIDQGKWDDDILIKRASKRSQLSIRAPSARIRFDSLFSKRLKVEQVEELECHISYAEIKKAVWDCGTNKSPGPDGIFPPGCNSNFIALIPKIQDAKVIKDFRPINLIGSVYKIIVKILANRLSMVIPDLINEVQTAFVSNRQILDGPFILNELITWCKHKKFNAMIFKIDFEKAFDSVRWDFLDDILKSFGFGDKWRSWIAGCLNSAKGSVLVNRSPTLEFPFHKGLKQGDPLSPFLFILVMESLHHDAVFVGEWNISNIKTIVSVLNCFFLASGLKINLVKSKLSGFGVSKTKINEAAALIGCSTFSAPFQYLRVTIGAPMLTLIKSVLNALPLYYMSLYKAPVAVLNELESIRRNFFHGTAKEDRKMVLIRWENILASKSKGGLGVSSNLDVSKSKIRGSIWQDMVHEFHSLKAKGIDCFSFIKRKLGNGENTLFWEDVWLGDCALKTSHPRIFMLEDRKDVTVAEKLGSASLDGSFRRKPRGGVEDDQYNNLVSITSQVLLPQMIDRWSWSLEASGDFSVSSVRHHIDEVILPSSDVPTRWVKMIPIKTNILAWKISLDRLPTRFNLSARGLEIQSILCPLCNVSAETSSHTFFACNL
ncbi:RNA-directed DNA polymerase, eukaryota [Tanacetum coccineum]